MFRLRDVRTLLLLALAIAAPASASVFGTSADLNGDKKLDVATAGHSRRDGAGYLLEISIRLGAEETRDITVRIARVAGRMFARDIDGDADRDLVVESFDREPLAVVLNDGDGEFHQGSLDDFHATVRRPRHNLPAADRLASNDGSFDPIESPAGQADADAVTTSSPLLTPARAGAAVGDAAVVLRHAVSATRGPPSTL
jgi:hypothetical protein